MDALQEGTGHGPAGGSRTLKALLACGVVSGFVYLAADAIASMRWAGYVFQNQAVSELVAIEAPTRPLMLFLFTVYNLLVLAFAAGVWRSWGAKRSVRVASVMLVIYAVVGELTQLFSPMHVRGSGAITATDLGHMILTAVEVLSIVAFIAFGSGARGRGWRIFSVLAILVIMAGGIITGALSTHMTALASSTPLAGLAERVNIYGTMLWIAAFGTVLTQTVREPNTEEAGSAAARTYRRSDAVTD